MQFKVKHKKLMRTQGISRDQSLTNIDIKQDFWSVFSVYRIFLFLHCHCGSWKKLWNFNEL